MNKEISQKVIETAVKKAPKNPDDALLMYLVVINRHTGKVEITEFPTLESVKSPSNCE